MIYNFSRSAEKIVKFSVWYLVWENPDQQTSPSSERCDQFPKYCKTDPGSEIFPMFNYLKPKPTDEISILAHPFIVAAGQLLPVASLCHQGELKQMIEGAEITYLHL